MTLPVFVEKICAHRGACAVCRNEAGGVDWRAAMQQAFQMPAGWPTCPIGLPMGATADAIAAGLTTAQIGRGAAGVARALTGTGGASRETIAERTAICEKCEKAVLHLGVLRQCSICKCATWAKIRNAGESCPMTPPKWTAQTAGPLAKL